MTLPDFFAYLFPRIAPQIAKELKLPYDRATSDNTALVQRRAAIDTCALATEFCVGKNQQYKSNDECVDYLTNGTVPWGAATQGGQNTVWCRYDFIADRVKTSRS